MEIEWFFSLRAAQHYNLFSNHHVLQKDNEYILINQSSFLGVKNFESISRVDLQFNLKEFCLSNWHEGTDFLRHRRIVPSDKGFLAQTLQNGHLWTQFFSASNETPVVYFPFSLAEISLLVFKTDFSKQKKVLVPILPILVESEIDFQGYSRLIELRDEDASTLKVNVTNLRKDAKGVSTFPSQMEFSKTPWNFQSSRIRFTEKEIEFFRPEKDEKPILRYQGVYERMRQDRSRPYLLETHETYEVETPLSLSFVSNRELRDADFSVFLFDFVRLIRSGIEGNHFQRSFLSSTLSSRNVGLLHCETSIAFADITKGPLNIPSPDIVQTWCNLFSQSKELSSMKPFVIWAMEENGFFALEILEKISSSSPLVLFHPLWTTLEKGLLKSGELARSPIEVRTLPDFTVMDKLKKRKAPTLLVSNAIPDGLPKNVDTLPNPYPSRFMNHGPDPKLSDDTIPLPWDTEILDAILAWSKKKLAGKSSS